MKTKPSAGIDAVREVLEGYATRGVFRSYSELPAKGAKATFRFHWLWNAPFTLAFDTERNAIAFEKLLDSVPPGSPVDLSVRRFLAEAASLERPEHRRVDRGRIAITVSNRSGALTLRFRIKNEEIEPAVRKAVNVVNELLASHLSMEHPEYLAKTFRLPED